MADPIQPSTFSQQDDSSTLAAAYQKASSFAPVTREDIGTAYKPYGLKLGAAKKSSTDQQLYSLATSKVIDWWKKQHAAAAPKQPKIAAPTTPSMSSSQIQQMLKQAGLGGAKPPAYALRSQNDLAAWIKRAIAQRKTGTGGSSSQGSAPILPDTSFKPGGVPATTLPPIQLPGMPPNFSGKAGKLL